MIQKTEIHEPTKGMVIVTVKTKMKFHWKKTNRYEIFHDKWTGDWEVVGKHKEKMQGHWTMTKSGAIQLALEMADTIENAEYEIAPDRTSA